MDARHDALGIGELARRTGASVRSLRHYEEHGVLPATRTAAGHRRFPAEAEETVHRIRLLLESGLPLAMVAEILPCFEGSAALDPCVATLLHDHLDVIRARIEALERQRATLLRLDGLIVRAAERPAGRETAAERA